MSQLFEALKKIQKKEHTSPKGPLPPPPSSPGSLKSKRITGLLGIALIILLLTGGGIFYYTQREETRLTPQNPTPTSLSRLSNKKTTEQSLSKGFAPTPPPSTEKTTLVSKKSEAHPKPLPQTPASKSLQKLPSKPQTSKENPQKTAPPVSSRPHAQAPPPVASKTQEAPPPLEMTENYKKTYLLMTASENLQQGDLLKALDLYQRYITLDNSNPQVWNNIGAIYLSMGEYERALAVLKRARHLNPQDPSILVNLAIALWETGNKKEAQRLVDELSLRDDLDPQTTYNLVALMIRMGLREEAFHVLKRAEARQGPSTLLTSLHPYFRDLNLQQPQKSQAGTPTAPK